MARRFKLTADGGSRGNPGPAGYGAVVTENGKIVAELFDVIGVATNNVAEYSGLLAGLTHIHSLDPVEATFLRTKVKSCKSSAVAVVFTKKVTKKITPTPTTTTISTPTPTPSVTPTPTPSVTPTPTPTPTGLALFKFANCTAAKAAGVTPIRKAINPGLYELNASLDRDKDGVACDS